MSAEAIDVVEGRDPFAVRRILESLPDWFGDPAAIDYYIRAAADPSMVSLLARKGSAVVGVALLRRPFPETAELHLIAVAPEQRRTGVGTALVEKTASMSRAEGCSCMTVNTVGPSFDSEPYGRTRVFYRALGFYPIAEHVGLDWWGPTLILVRPLLELHETPA